MLLDKEVQQMEAATQLWVVQLYQMEVVLIIIQLLVIIL